MKKVLLDRTPLWEIRPEETIILDINSSLVENELEQIKMYYETNKEEIYINTLQEKDKEIERLNNIINEVLGIANERVNYYHHINNKEMLEDWSEIFDVLVKRDKLQELKGDGSNEKDTNE